MIAQTYLASAFILGFTIVYYVVLARQGYGLSFGATVNRILRVLVWKDGLGGRLGQKANTYSQRQKALCRDARHLVVGPDAEKLHWWPMYDPRPVLYPFNIFNHPLLT
jgi:hypothetical protein